MGMRKWKEMRAVIDTGCHAGDLVSLEVVEDLGIKNISKPTEQDNQELQSVHGGRFTAYGAVNLSWRGVPKGKVMNVTRNFKTRFLVIDPQGTVLPFEILIGSETIWKCGILHAPVLMGKVARDRNTVIIPPENKCDKKDPKGLWHLRLDETQLLTDDQRRQRGFQTSQRRE